MNFSQFFSNNFCSDNHRGVSDKCFLLTVNALLNKSKFKSFMQAAVLAFRIGDESLLSKYISPMNIQYDLVFAAKGSRNVVSMQSSRSSSLIAARHVIISCSTNLQSKVISNHHGTTLLVCPDIICVLPGRYLYLSMGG